MTTESGTPGILLRLPKKGGMVDWVEDFVAEAIFHRVDNAKRCMTALCSAAWSDGILGAGFEGDDMLESWKIHVEVAGPDDKQRVSDLIQSFLDLE